MNLVERLKLARAYGEAHGFDWKDVPDAELAGELGPALFREDHGVVAAAIYQGLVVEPSVSEAGERNG